MQIRVLLPLAAAAALGLAGCHHRSADEDSDAANAGAEDLNNTSEEAVADTDAALAAASNDAADPNGLSPNASGSSDDQTEPALGKADDAAKH